MRLSKVRKFCVAVLLCLGLILSLILILPILFKDSALIQPIAFFRLLFIDFADFLIFLLPFWFFAEALLVFFRKAGSEGGRLLLFALCPLTVLSVFAQTAGGRAPVLAARLGGEDNHSAWIFLNTILFLVFAAETVLFVYYAYLLVRQPSKRKSFETNDGQSLTDGIEYIRKPQTLRERLREKKAAWKNFLSSEDSAENDGLGEVDQPTDPVARRSLFGKIKRFFPHAEDDSRRLRTMESISYPPPETRPRFRRPADDRTSEQIGLSADRFTEKSSFEAGGPFDEDGPFTENETVISVPDENEVPFAFFEQDEEEAFSEAPAPADADSRGAAQTAAAARRRRSSGYKLPGKELLSQHQESQYWVIDEDTKEAAEILRRTLEEFGIQAQVTGITRGPVVTMFELLPAPGVKLSKIANLADNIALRLAAGRVRIAAPIPGKHAVGIEVPNRKRALVSFKELTPHLLIAGSTGSGKSVCVNSIITSVLYKKSPEDVRMILIDPKIVELKMYNDIPHLLTPVITDAKRAYMALQYGLSEMERRYNLLDALGARNIESYNRKAKESGMTAPHLPYILIVIDEFADLMAANRKDLEQAIARLAAMSRAVGIHLILATQRPSVDVITGLIKANIPSRIAFMTASKIDSRTILDTVGAEKLLGKGDMLYVSSSSPYPTRIQGTYLSEHEVEAVTDYVKTLGEPDYLDDEIFMDESEILEDNGDDDPLFDEALQIVVQTGKASASYLQRRLQVGYNRAARMIETMEARGYIGPQNGSKPREVLVTPDRI